MVRRGSSRPRDLAQLAAVVGLAVGLLALAGCSDGAGDGAGDGGLDGDGTPITAATSATLPGDAEVGLGYFVLDGRPIGLVVRSCNLVAVTNPASGVTRELDIEADDGVSVSVAITRDVTQGDVPTTTDEIRVVEGDLLLESQRFDIGGRYQDLRVAGALEPLLGVDGDLVTAEGVFGPEGSQVGDDGLVEASLILRCPPAG